MPLTQKYSNKTVGIAFAVITCIIWSGNYIIARGISSKIPPASLAFFRWFFAMVCIAPLAWKKFIAEKEIIFKNKVYFTATALCGFTLFNLCLYIAGHHTTAINLALISTTAAPIFSITIAFVFYKEKLQWNSIVGMFICFIGIVVLITNGEIQKLVLFHFSVGDIWALLGALSFAIYNNLAKQKPKGVSSLNFLFVGFVIGTALLFPLFLYELFQGNQPIIFSNNVIGSIIYLGFGCSFICYLLWNKSIQLIGPSKTVLFGNLIPLFSTIEAVFLLNESFTKMHFIAGIIVLLGLTLANIRFSTSTIKN